MADVDVVADLLERWRAAGPLARVHVAIEAQQHIASLSPTQKRALAVEVASRVAPQLVPQIEGEDGDLSPEQVQALVDLLRRADDEDLGDLVDALRSGDVAPALALADDAMDVLAPPPTPEGPDEGPDERPDGATAEDPGHGTGGTSAVVADGPAPPGPGRDGATTDGHGGDEQARRPARTGAGAAATALGAAGAARRASGTAGPGDAGPDAAAHTPDDAHAAQGLDRADAALDAAQDRADALEDQLADEASLRAQVEAAASSSDRWRESSPASTAPAYQLPDTVFDLDAEDLPDTSVDAVATVLERAESDARDVAARRAGARPGPVAAAPELVRHVPDGYRRRRVALQALRDGRLHDAEDVLDVVRTLGRETDRAWVAGAALDARVLGVDDLRDVRLGDAARARLVRRQA